MDQVFDLTAERKKRAAAIKAAQRATVLAMFDETMQVIDAGLAEHRREVFRLSGGLSLALPAGSVPLVIGAPSIPGAVPFMLSQGDTIQVSTVDRPFDPERPADALDLTGLNTRTPG